MSWQAVEAVMKYSRSKGSERMLLMVIATHAERDSFTTFVSIETLCAEANMKERNLQYTLAKLRASGELLVSRGIGRGHASTFTLWLGPEKKVQRVAPIREEKGAIQRQGKVQSVAERVQSSVEKVQYVAPPPIEPEIQPENQVGAEAPPKPKTDPRSKHPAIQAIKALMSRYPEKVLYDDLIAVLGERPDMRKLSACRKAWIKAGYNPNSLAWALDWYAQGIPERFDEHGKNNGRGDQGPDRSGSPTSGARANILRTRDYSHYSKREGSPPARYGP